MEGYRELHGKFLSGASAAMVTWARCDLGKIGRFGLKMWPPTAAEKAWNAQIDATAAQSFQKPPPQY
jgi:hypothetical protein